MSRICLYVQKQANGMNNERNSQENWRFPWNLFYFSTKIWVVRSAAAAVVVVFVLVKKVSPKLLVNRIHCRDIDIDWKYANLVHVKWIFLNIFFCMSSHPLNPLWFIDTEVLKWKFKPLLKLILWHFSGFTFRCK